MVLDGWSGFYRIGYLAVLLKEKTGLKLHLSASSFILRYYGNLKSSPEDGGFSHIP